MSESMKVAWCFCQRKVSKGFHRLRGSAINTKQLSPKSCQHPRFLTSNHFSQTDAEVNKEAEEEVQSPVELSMKVVMPLRTSLSRILIKTLPPPG